MEKPFYPVFPRDRNKFCCGKGYSTSNNGKWLQQNEIFAQHRRKSWNNSDRNQLTLAMDGSFMKVHWILNFKIPFTLFEFIQKQKLLTSKSLLKKNKKISIPFHFRPSQLSQLLTVDSRKITFRKILAPRPESLSGWDSPKIVAWSVPYSRKCAIKP